MAIHKYLVESGQITQLFEAYGLVDVEIMDFETGYRNHSFPAVTASGQKVNLILYKNEPGILARIKTANKVSNFLAGRGLPARTSADPRILKLCVGSQVRYAALYNYLPGATIPWEAYTKAHLKQLGQTMASMHKNLASLPQIDAPNVAAEYLSIAEHMEAYFAQAGVEKAMGSKLGLSIDLKTMRHFKNILKVCEQLPNQQMLHMDFVRGNVLFGDERQVGITGILDFEKAGYSHPLLDVARTLAFLFIDCKYKTYSEVHKSFLVSGYVRSGHKPFNDVILNSKHRKISLLNELVDLFLLHDFYKFLRHNPYEFLNENEHFVRTKNYLLKQQIIDTVA